MRTTSPTAGTAHSAFKLGKRLLNANTSRLRFFARCNPTDPLIAREWRYILPHRPRRGRAVKGFSQIHWHFVHKIILLNSPLKRLKLSQFPHTKTGRAERYSNSCHRTVYRRRGGAQGERAEGQGKGDGMGPTMNAATVAILGP